MSCRWSRCSRSSRCSDAASTADRRDASPTARARRATSRAARGPPSRRSGTRGPGHRARARTSGRTDRGPGRGTRRAVRRSRRREHARVPRDAAESDDDERAPRRSTRRPITDGARRRPDGCAPSWRMSASVESARADARHAGQPPTGVASLVPSADGTAQCPRPAQRGHDVREPFDRSRSKTVSTLAFAEYQLRGAAADL